MPNKGKYGKYRKHCTSCVYCIKGYNGWLYCRHRDSKFTTAKGVCEKHIDTRSKEGKHDGVYFYEPTIDKDNIDEWESKEYGEQGIKEGDYTI